MYYFPGGWFSDLLAWCLKVPVVRYVVVPLAIGVMLWSPWAEIAPPYVTITLPSECIPESMITFTFDNGYESTYSKALPILKKYGFVATVYVVTDFIGKPRYMTKEQLWELGKSGWWIGSKTVTNPSLTELSSQEVWQELKQSKEVLRAWGFEVVDFASPHGEYNELTLGQIQRLYATHRTLTPDINKRPIDRYQLKALELHNNTPIEEVFEWILRAKQEKAWLILVLHQIDGQGKWSYQSQDLEAIAKFAKEQGFEGVCPFVNLNLREGG